MQDLYLPAHARGNITPHAIIALPRPGTVELLLCFDSELLFIAVMYYGTHYAVLWHTLCCMMVHTILSTVLILCDGLCSQMKGCTSTQVEDQSKTHDYSGGKFPPPLVSPCH